MSRAGTGRHGFWAGVFAAGVFVWTATAATAQEPKTATPDPANPVYRGPSIAMHGEPKYRPGFKQFDYVNPNAPKGGRLRLVAIGTFDSLNPFIIKGVRNGWIRVIVHDNLMSRSADEPFTMYPLIALEIELPRDRSWVVFHLDPRARFHDGSPITVDDVIFSFKLLRDKGLPFYRAFFRNVTAVRKVGPRAVKFSFVPGQNRELPLILGDLPILSKRYWQARDFEKTTLVPVPGSGPYRIAKVDPGRSITFRRIKDYWAQDLPPRVGHYNFDVIRVDYYRDATLARQALKAGAFDYWFEGQAKAWATAYDVPPVKRGDLILARFPHGRTAGMQGFVFNTRKAVFRDRRVRQALAYAFDFAWTNKNLFHGQYSRLRSYFDNSELASRGLPAGDELEILRRYRGRIPGEVFAKPYRPPSYDGSGKIRSGLRPAFRLLEEAGWKVRDMKLFDARTGRRMRFEILLDSPASERFVLPFVRNLRRMGVEARVRLVDSSQYVARLRKFDYDMIVGAFRQPMSPGNEQRIIWSSRAAKAPGSRNYIGVDDPVVDELVELVIAAPDRASLVARTRALDRVLLWNHFVIPHWHIPYDRIVYWNKFGVTRPTLRGSRLMTWWIDRKKAAALGRRRGRAD